MSFFQVDTSALVKRYVLEAGSAWIQSLCQDNSGHTIAISQVTPVEVASALARKLREGTITPEGKESALRLFLGDCKHRYQIIRLKQSIIEKAVQLTQQHPLRAYDALQLASALVVNDSLVQAELDPLILLSADERLCEAGRAEGLLVDNPSLH